MDTAMAVSLVRSEDPAEVERGIAFLRARAEDDSGNASAWFDYGGALDYADREAEAMIAYQHVIETGVDRLPPADRPRLFVQAGSTLRNLGRFDDARELLEQGRRDHPGVAAITAFLALVEVSAGNERRAVDLLFEALLAPTDGSVQDYHRALTWYAEDIRNRG